MLGMVGKRGAEGASETISLMWLVSQEYSARFCQATGWIALLRPAAAQGCTLFAEVPVTY